jgi:hypothetical protein
LRLLVHCGTAITIRAAIYVLIGAVTGYATAYAPCSIALAGMVEATKNGNSIGDRGAIVFVLD